MGLYVYLYGKTAIVHLCVGACVCVRGLERHGVCVCVSKVGWKLCGRVCVYSWKGDTCTPVCIWVCV